MLAVASHRCAGAGHLHHSSPQLSCMYRGLSIAASWLLMHLLPCQAAAGQVFPVGACLHAHSVQLCLPAMASACSV